MPQRAENIRPHGTCEPAIGRGVYIDPSAVVIGDVTIGSDSSVWPMAVIRGDVQRIRIGHSCSIQDGSILHVTHAGPHTGGGWPLILGNQVTVGHRVVLHGCEIGNQVLMGVGSVVMDGAVIEDQVIVGAGTLVPPGKTLSGGHLYIGSPARQARPLTAREREFLSYTADNYCRLKDKYLLENARDDNGH